ncbi:Tetratricopeptide repeat protein [Phycisphaerae bacterium RAS1]|nr:Tetratricopeptide repeat protein [Phycisphaerae bacterium RAS1]
MDAFIELTYTRRIDDRDVHLVAILPTVRPLSIGGNPSDLRLPGVAAGVSYAIIGHTDGRFTIEREAAGDAVRVNDDPLDDPPRELRDGDIIAIDGYCLQFHEGELPEGEMHFDTPLRWRLRIPGVVQHGESIEIEDASSPYTTEFQTLAQPAWQAKDFDAIEREAARELRRIDRLDEVNQLSRYCQFLWRARITAASRAERADEAEQLCREAVALYPDSAPLLVWLGMSLLRRKQWQEAAEAFRRAQRTAGVVDLFELHVARLGALLALDEAAAAAPIASSRSRADAAAAEPAPLRTDAPGDEALLFFLARANNVYGPEDFVQFRFLGRIEKPGEAEFVQRWEIIDRSTGTTRQRRVVAPGLPWADPALVTEVSLVAKMLTRDEPEWSRGLIDASHETRMLRVQPVQFEDAAVEFICRSRPAGAECLRLSTTSASGGIVLVVAWQPKPHSGDVVYQQGRLKVAVAESAVETVTNARIAVVRVRRRPTLVLWSQSFSPIIIDQIGGAVRATRRLGAQISVPSWLLIGLVLIGLLRLGMTLLGR